MYFTYCQAWLLVVFRALWHEYVLREGSRWDKTVRFGTPRPGDPTAPAAPAATPAGGVGPTLPVILALLLFLAGSARADTLLEGIGGERPILDSHWGEFYAEGVYLSREDNNVIGMADLKDGFRLARLAGAEVLAYGKARAFMDTQGEFWNNKALFGPGLRVKPFPSLGLHLFAEYLFGTYFGIEGSTPNPYDKTFDGLEGGAAFWQRWGALPKETGFFLPFTGWRELYWDALYFQRDDDNLIGVAQYREGFGAIHFGPVASDIYLRANGGVDLNKDYWNNYVEGSLGVRFRPASDALDMRLAVEFVGGTYIDRDGRYERPYDKEYIGARVELTLWFGW